MKNIILLILTITLFLSGCEKDDICDANTPTTPRLIIEFYNSASPSELKPVDDLKLISDIEGIDTTFADVTRIAVPLQTTADVTRYRFVLNYNSTDPALIYEDTLEFNYTRENIFVSRACGYKTLFTLNDNPELPDGVILNDDPNTDLGSWIDNIVVEKNNLETENEVHIRILF
ncbi:MAG TPA: DUF6452 family protein [Flavobacterium sp.]